MGVWPSSHRIGQEFSPDRLQGARCSLPLWGGKGRTDGRLVHAPDTLTPRWISQSAKCARFGAAGGSRQPGRGRERPPNPVVPLACTRHHTCSALIWEVFPKPAVYPLGFSHFMQIISIFRGSGVSGLPPPGQAWLGTLRQADKT